MLSISSISALNDNYIWLLSNSDGHCLIVDPGVAKPIIEQITQRKLTLDAILLTHHHHDHTDGVQQLLQLYPNIKIYGPDTPRFKDVNFPLQNKATFTALGVQFTALAIPGHTLDHIAYYSTDILFCGDTLFSAGCGRIFEGTPAQMHNSLTLLSSLPDKTKVYCAHEYTLANLLFAQQIEPNNHALSNYAKQIAELRSQGLPSLPTTIGTEKAINPFLRAHHPDVKAAVKKLAEDSSNLATFTALRRWKDKF